jgi:peptidyl-tRNA hydrolase, PTH1 family
MFLIAGLGNPGAEYAANRHNIGFMVLDALAHQEKALPWRRKFQAELSFLDFVGDKVLLLKPQTFMNLSGQSIGEALRFHKIALSNLIVFHDELDLPLGTVRVKYGGGDAGHNGLRSITAHCGPLYRRVRLGISHPGDKSLVHQHVLSDFSASERARVEQLCDSCARYVTHLLQDDEAGFRNRVAADLA